MKNQLFWITRSKFGAPDRYFFSNKENLKQGMEELLFGAALELGLDDPETYAVYDYWNVVSVIRKDNDGHIRFIVDPAYSEDDMLSANLLSVYLDAAVWGNLDIDPYLVEALESLDAAK